MSFQNNVLSFDTSRTAAVSLGPKVEHRAAIDSCRQVVRIQIPKLLGGMFENLDDALYDLADKAESNIRQNAFFDAMREIRKDRARIEAGFGQRVAADFDLFWSGGVAPNRKRGESDQSEENLSLLGEEDLEEGLAISNMTSRGENRHYRALYALNQRFGHMLGGVELDTKENPLSPGAICEAFHQMFKEMDVDIPVKLVVYKQFQIQVIDLLGGFYDELNSLLTEAGVLPKLTQKIRRSRHYPTGGGNAPALRESREEAVASKAEESELQTELFSSLKQMLSEKRLGSSSAHLSSAPLPVIGTNEMLHALSALQQAEIPVAPQVVDGIPGSLDMRANLFQVMGLAKGEAADKKISGSDEDAIDVIAMLFEFILEDRNLPDAMKALLARLQIPMLKVAILDRTFFHSKAHPARRLLNAMASAAVGWSEQSGRSDGGLYGKMERIVERILNDFDKDIELFTRLFDEFNDFIQREEQGSRLAEQRVAQVTHGKEQLNAARHRVFEEINNRLFGNDWIPSPVVTLIKDGWRDVLLLLILRKGEESDEWRNALGLMDKLLRSVRPHPDSRRRQELLDEIPPLLKGLRTGLKEISYDQHKMARVFKELQACHLKCLKGEAPGQDTVAAAAAPGQSTATTTDVQHSAQPESDAPTRQEVTDQVMRDEHQTLAESMPVGTWLEIQDGNGMRFRAKLSWRSTVSGTCLFVNRKGMKVVEIPLAGFASWLRTGKAELLDGGTVPLMDRALKAMVDVLQKTETAD